MISYCLGFVFDHVNTQVMLINKKQPEWQSGKVNAIGGHVFPAEWACHAMTRLCKAESGLYIKKWHKVCEYELLLSDCILYVFCAYADLAEAVSTTDETLVIAELDTVATLDLVPYTNIFFRKAIEVIVCENV